MLILYILSDKVVTRGLLLKSTMHDSSLIILKFSIIIVIFLFPEIVVGLVSFIDNFRNLPPRVLASFNHLISISSCFTIIPWLSIHGITFIDFINLIHLKIVLVWISVWLNGCTRSTVAICFINQGDSVLIDFICRCHHTCRWHSFLGWIFNIYWYHVFML